MKQTAHLPPVKSLKLAWSLDRGSLKDADLYEFVLYEVGTVLNQLFMDSKVAFLTAASVTLMIVHLVPFEM
jgi:hypothetical protein